MNSEPSQQYNDEIDLADLVRSLWDGKWVVIGTTIATVMVGLIYLIITPKTYTGALAISPLPTLQAEAYLILNESGLIGIDSNKLETLFIEEILTYKGLEASIKENSYLEKLESESELEFSFRIKNAARAFSLTAPDKEKQPKWTIALTTQQPELAIKVISDALSFANVNVNRQVKNMMDKDLVAHSMSIKIALEDIDLASTIILSHAELNTQSRLAFLGEQAALARAIGIEKNTLGLQTFTTQSTLINSVNKDEPFYLRGYLAIEKETEILLSRQSPRLFIPELILNEKIKQELLNDRTVSRTKTHIAATPIGTDAFAAVSYDLVALRFQSNTKQSLILALSIVLGGMLGIFLLLIRNTVVRKE